MLSERIKRFGAVFILGLGSLTSDTIQGPKDLRVDLRNLKEGNPFNHLGELSQGKVLADLQRVKEVSHGQPVDLVLRRFYLNGEEHLSYLFRVGISQEKLFILGKKDKPQELVVPDKDLGVEPGFVVRFDGSVEGTFFLIEKEELERLENQKEKTAHIRGFYSQEDGEIIPQDEVVSRVVGADGNVSLVFFEPYPFLPTPKYDENKDKSPGKLALLRPIQSQTVPSEEYPEDEANPSFPRPVNTKEIKINGQNYPISCELAVSAEAISYVLGHSGIKIPFEGDIEELLVREIPKDPNPNKGFRGDVTKPQSLENYGVYAPPLQKLLEEFDIPSEVIYLGEDPYASLEELINKGYPVVIWLSWSRGQAVVKTDFIGEEPNITKEEYKLIPGEHTVLVVGVRRINGRRSFLVMDPLPQNEGSMYWLRGFPRWEEFDYMRLVVGKGK